MRFKPLLIFAVCALHAGAQTIVLRSPCIATWKKQDAGFYLSAEPGITLSPGASGSRDARTFHWDCKVAVKL